MFPAFLVRPLRLVLALVALATAAELAAVRFAAADGERTLVVRGRVLDASGSPATNARITVRGAVRLTSPTSDEGRYSIIVPLGTAAALRREPIHLEVRADANGRKFSKVSGGSVLVLDVTLVPGAPARVHVRSNAPDAAKAIASAFAVDGPATAWVDEDFGGPARAGGERHAEEVVAVPGVEPIASDGRSLRDSLQHAEVEHVRDSVSAVRRASEAAARARVLAQREEAERERADREAAERARHDSLQSVAAEARRADSLRVAIAREAQQAAASRRASEARARFDSLERVRADARARDIARRDSITMAVAAKRRADSLAWETRRLARRAAAESASVASLAPASASGGSSRTPGAPRTPPQASSGASVPRTPPSGSISASARPDDAPVAPPPSTASSRIRRIEPFATPSPVPSASTAAAESCACRIRGTVEVQWERPLEFGLPVDVRLEGPVTRQQRIELFMGSPREFRFGPLPCGDYRLVAEPHGKLRYRAASGDSLLAVPCRGASEVRLTLAPARR